MAKGNGREERDVRGRWIGKEITERKIISVVYL